MNGLLLDTHTLLWLISSKPIQARATLAINAAQRSETLFLSPITAWEIGAAMGKKDPAKRPELQGLAPSRWFTEGVKALNARVQPITVRIATEAGTVPSIYGYGDPGDCFLTATARIRNLTLVTRDAKILALAERHPTYLTALAC